METSPEHPDRAGDRAGSRRAFLARLTATTFAPIVLSACGKRSGAEVANSSGEAASTSAGDVATAIEPSSPPPPAVAAGPRIPRSEPVVRVRVLTVRDRTKRLQVGVEGTWIEMRSLRTPPPPGAAMLGGATPGAAAFSGATTGMETSRDRESGGDDSNAVPAFSLYHAPVTIALGAAGWSVVDARGFRPKVFGMNTLELRAVEVAGGTLAALPITVAGRRYHGSIRFVAAGAATSRGYDVINHVAIEEYLPGVLEKELYSHWKLHTFAAQAIAARSYACAERFHRARRPYDMTNTTSSQMYIGSDAHDRAIEAVRMTRGMVLEHHGGLVPGYYSSCCGGLAADALDAISLHPVNDTPPLRGRAGPDVCTAADLFSWTIARSHRDVTRRLAAWGRRNGDEALAALRKLRAITLDAANAHGRPTAFAITGGDGTVTSLGAENLRRAVDYSGAGLGRPAKRLWSSNVRVTVDKRGVRFDGSGHGHGVGMCQHGAEALARDGFTYDAILEWYYPRARVERGYI